MLLSAYMLKSVMSHYCLMIRKLVECVSVLQVNPNEIYPHEVPVVDSNFSSL